MERGPKQERGLEGKKGAAKKFARGRRSRESKDYLERFTTRETEKGNNRQEGKGGSLGKRGGKLKKSFLVGRQMRKTVSE